MNHQNITMAPQLLDGRKAAEAWRKEIFDQVQAMIAAGHRPPALTAVRIGEDPASALYVKNKMKAAQSVGFHFDELTLPADVSQQQAEDAIRGLNDDPLVDGYILQLPIPDHLDLESLILSFSARKDADGFHPLNIGRLFREHPEAILPATPQGILRLLDHYHIEVEGKHCVVVGRSFIVGKPMAMLLQRKKGRPGNATVTLTHSRTPDIARFTRQADILIVAVGRPHWLDGEMIKEGSVIIDVGIHRVQSARGPRWTGDVDFASAAPKARWITPVPGGIGPMTVASLLWNVLLIARRRRGL